MNILIIGAGPSGLAAAASAAKYCTQVDIIDDNFNSGGQIWRGGAQNNRDEKAKALWEKLGSLKNIRFHFQSKVVHVRAVGSLYEVMIESMKDVSAQCLTADKVIIATGARELLLPFPGWTLPGVTGAGGLQALSKTGYPVKGKRIIVAGTGPLLLAVAASLIERGAIVTHILEQTTFSNLFQFSLNLFLTPSKIGQALKLWMKLRQINYVSNSYVVEALGQTTITGVRASLQSKEVELSCDYLACGYGLIANIELAAALNCKLGDHGNSQHVIVDAWQETSQKNVYCVGEGTGVGGVDLALTEGYIAGFAATEQRQEAERYFAERDSWKRFARSLHSAFALRPELRQLCRNDTLVCRCEDVSYGQLQEHTDWRSAKLHSRCGMGACQGRICGAANRFLFSWEKDAGRLPFGSTKIGSLTLLDHSKSTENNLN